MASSLEEQLRWADLSSRFLLRTGISWVISSHLRTAGMPSAPASGQRQTSCTRCAGCSSSRGGSSVAAQDDAKAEHLRRCPGSAPPPGLQCRRSGVRGCAQRAARRRPGCSSRPAPSPVPATACAAGSRGELHGLQRRDRQQPALMAVSSRQAQRPPSCQPGAPGASDGVHREVRLGAHHLVQPRVCGTCVPERGLPQGACPADRLAADMPRMPEHSTLSTPPQARLSARTCKQARGTGDFGLEVAPQQDVGALQVEVDGAHRVVQVCGPARRQSEALKRAKRYRACARGGGPMDALPRTRGQHACGPA